MSQPCSITITQPFVGVQTGGNLTSITISGTVSGPCPNLLISANCGPAGVATGTATVDPNGNWTITLPPPTNCKCDGTLFVSASCTDPFTGKVLCSTPPVHGPIVCSCSLTINTPFVGNPQTGYTNVTITGTITPSGVCSQALIVNLSCKTETAQGTATITGTQWTATVPLKSCTCGDTVTVTASCENMSTGAIICSATTTSQIACPNCCPTITPSYTSRGCESGKRTICLTAVIDIPPNCPVTVYWDWGDNTAVGTSHTYSNPPNAQVTLPFECHDYDPGPSGQSYSAQLNVSSPPGCPPSTLTVNVQPCDCCPDISTAYDFGICDSNGNRPVTITVTVKTKPNCPDVQIELVFEDGSSVVSPIISPNTTYTWVLPPKSLSPGQHSVTINVLIPRDCPPVKRTFTVLPCDCCPGVSVTPCIADCDKHGNREVTFTITVNAKPPPCPTIQVQMDFGDGSPPGAIHTFPASSEGSYTETHTYTGNAALQDNNAVLNVLKPRGCPGWSQVIPKCCTRKKTRSCNALFYIMTVSLALALVLSLLSLCGITVSFYVILGFLAAFALAFMVYLLLGCPKCRCGWLYLLLWRVLFGVGLLYAIFAGCCSPWSILIGLGLMIIGFVFLLLWKKKCCVKFCPFLKEIVWWVGTTVLPLVGIIKSIVGTSCYYILFTLPWPPHNKFYFLDLVWILWGLLLAYYLDNCT